MAYPANEEFAKRVVEVLNRALEEDLGAINYLFSQRVSCSDELADDLEIQIAHDSKKGNTVGFLGLLNGIVGVDSNNRGIVEMLYNDIDGVVGFLVAKIKNMP
jgi:hypothetical protein